MNLLGILPRSESIDESLSLRTRGAYFELYCLQLRAPLYQTTTVDEDESYCPRTGTVVRLSTVGEGSIQATTELGRAQSWIVGLRNTGSHVTKLVAILAIQIENNRHDKTLSASRGHAICEKHSWQIWPAGYMQSSQIPPKPLFRHLSVGSLRESSIFSIYDFICTEPVGLLPGSTSPFQFSSAVGRSSRSLLYPGLGESEKQAPPPPPPPPPQPFPSSNDQKSMALYYSQSSCLTQV
ncbi:hypothetical protein BGZ57DRAFT_954446 [Hyaloscypha finlandica]|nr:hypothetical protein BGZ57DRAFT_954446 [Hyaloscypha finlandica]